MQAKKQGGFFMINLENYFAIHPAMESGTHDVFWMILRYFKSHRYAEFKTQLEICDALKKEFKLTDNNVCTQGAISKALKRIQGQDIQIGNDIYALLKDEGSYALRIKDSNDLSMLFEIGNIFKKEEVYNLSSNTLVIAFKNKGAEKFKEALNKIYSEDVFFDLLICDNALLMMFNEKHPYRDDIFYKMQNFFKSRARHLKKIKSAHLHTKAEKDNPNDTECGNNE